MIEDHVYIFCVCISIYMSEKMPKVSIPVSSCGAMENLRRLHNYRVDSLLLANYVHVYTIMAYNVYCKAFVCSVYVLVCWC